MRYQKAMAILQSHGLEPKGEDRSSVPKSPDNLLYSPAKKSHSIETPRKNLLTSNHAQSERHTQ